VLVVCPKETLLHTSPFADVSICKLLVASKPHKSFRPLNKEKCLRLAQRIDFVSRKRSPVTKDEWKIYFKVLLLSELLIGHLQHIQTETIAKTNRACSVVALRII
jgi:hypothetical protein